MTHEDEGHYAQKHPAGREVNPCIVEAVKKKATGGNITCAAAFGIVKRLNTSPEEVGFTADRLEIKLAKCQLGLFGYSPDTVPVKPVDKVPKDMEKAIRESLTGGRLTCRSAWDIAERLGIRKMDITAACNKLNIKLSSCQLGAF
jgi:hypothetical protein